MYSLDDMLWEDLGMSNRMGEIPHYIYSTLKVRWRGTSELFSASKQLVRGHDLLIGCHVVNGHRGVLYSSDRSASREAASKGFPLNCVWHPCKLKQHFHVQGGDEWRRSAVPLQILIMVRESS